MPAFPIGFKIRELSHWYSPVDGVSEWSELK